MSEHLSTILPEVISRFGIQSLEIERRLGGYSSTNHRVVADGAAYVLKIRGSSAGLDREIRSGRSLLEVGLPWPSPLETRDGLYYVELDSVTVQLIPFIEGRTLHRPTLTKNALRSSARIARTIHSLHAEEGEVEVAAPLEEVVYDATRSRVNKKIQATCLTLLDLKMGLLKRLSGMAFREAFIHGDLHGENLLFDKRDQVCAVLDLENAGRGSIGYDIFSFISMTCCTAAFSPRNCYVAAPFLHEYFIGEGELHKMVGEAFRAYLYKWAQGTFLEREAMRGNEMVVPLIERDEKKFAFIQEGIEGIVDLFVEGIRLEEMSLEEMSSERGTI